MLIKSLAYLSTISPSQAKVVIEKIISLALEQQNPNNEKATFKLGTSLGIMSGILTSSQISLSKTEVSSNIISFIENVSHPDLQALGLRKLINCVNDGFSFDVVKQLINSIFNEIIDKVSLSPEDMGRLSDYEDVGPIDSIKKFSNAYAYQSETHSLLDAIMSFTLLDIPKRYHHIWVNMITGFINKYYERIDKVIEAILNKFKFLYIHKLNSYHISCSKFLFKFFENWHCYICKDSIILKRIYMESTSLLDDDLFPSFSDKLQGVHSEIATCFNQLTHTSNYDFIDKQSVTAFRYLVDLKSQNAFENEPKLSIPWDIISTLFENLVSSEKSKSQGKSLLLFSHLHKYISILEDKWCKTINEQTKEYCNNFYNIASQNCYGIYSTRIYLKVTVSIIFLTH